MSVTAVDVIALDASSGDYDLTHRHAHSHRHSLELLKTVQSTEDRLLVNM